MSSRIEAGGLPSATEMIQKYDTNKSGFIDPPELVSLINDELLQAITLIVADAMEGAEGAGGGMRWREISFHDRAMAGS